MMTPRGKIKLNLEIYKTIIATTVRYANVKIPEEDWAEVYGLLYGYINGDDVIVTEAIPFTHTKKQRHILKVEFDEEDYALAASIESEFYIKDPPQYIVGWYHSHPGIKLMLSQDDVKNYQIMCQYLHFYTVESPACDGCEGDFCLCIRYWNY